MISETLRSLLVYVKQTPDIDFKWSAVRAHVLGRIYHESMSLENVFKVCLNAFEEAAADPRFELAYRHEPMRNLMMEPMSMVCSPWAKENQSSRFTVEEFYQMMLDRLLSELRLTRVDWCKQELGLH